MGLKRPEEALDAFMDALAFAERDEEMHDTFSQFLLAAEQTKGDQFVSPCHYHYIIVSTAMM